VKDCVEPDGMKRDQIGWNVARLATLLPILNVYSIARLDDW